MTAPDMSGVKTVKMTMMRSWRTVEGGVFLLVGVDVGVGAPRILVQAAISWIWFEPQVLGLLAVVNLLGEVIDVESATKSARSVILNVKPSILRNTCVVPRRM